MWRRGGLMGSARAKRKPSRLNWRARRALRSAEMLDDIVDSQLELVPHLAESARQESADHLAEMVMLAQAYRHYAVGWISRGELERRGRASVHRFGRRASPSAQRLAEHE